MNGEVDPPGPQGERAFAGVKLKEGGSQSRLARWTGRRTEGEPPGIVLPRGVPSIYPTG